MISWKDRIGNEIKMLVPPKSSEYFPREYGLCYKGEYEEVVGTVYAGERYQDGIVLMHGYDGIDYCAGFDSWTIQKTENTLQDLMTNMENDMTEVENFFMNKLSKVCINAYPTTKPYITDRKRQWYRHPDLNDMSKEAFDAGENWFYCKPANPDNPNGKQVKCEPIYKYKCDFSLSEEEYEDLKMKCADRI